MLGASKITLKSTAPLFKSQSYFQGKISDLSLLSFKDKYLVLFFYPLNFTFVCPTELIKFSHKAQQWRKDLNTEIVGVSVDSVFSHMYYSKLARNEGGLGGDLEYPLLSDLGGQISRDYGVYNGALAYRGTFIIDPKQDIRHISISDNNVGRNVDEVERLLEAFQFSEKSGDVCPASWKKGDPTMKGSHDSTQTQNYWKNVHTKA